MSRVVGLLVIGLGLLGVTRANGQTITGQAFDLKGNPIPNVTVQLLTEEGVLVDEQFFANGNYTGLTLPPTADNRQGFRVIFSSPGRETIAMVLYARKDHSLYVAMPEGKTQCQQSFCGRIRHRRARCCR